MNCRDIEDALAAYVDGMSTDATRIAAHLETCAACRELAHAQSVTRRVLQARAAQLSPIAPPGLQTRLHALCTEEIKTSRPDHLKASSWTRLSAFSAALLVVLTVGAVLLPVVTSRSTAVLAAQLALDHLKCFTIDGDADATPIEKQAAETTLKNDFDFSMVVPSSSRAEHVQLMAVRRCLYGDGLAAHLLYRVDGEPVSLFIVPGLARPAAELTVLGHDEVVWAQGDRTYMLVARAGSRAHLSRVADYLRNEAK